jgi:molecular chaperone DnaK
MYALGIDLGTTFTAAATWRNGHAETASLGSRASSIPSVVLLRADETFLTGEGANRRGLSEPHRVAREFKRRLGDTTPILLGGVPYSAEALMARLLRSVVDEVSTREGGPAGTICVSHPANWGPYKTDLLLQAVRLAGLDEPVSFTTEPEAAAVFYAQQQRIEPGAIVAVYDLGGGTFDAAVLRKTLTGFEILGRPEGIERLGGIDFDAAVFSHVSRALGTKLAELDEDDPSAIAAVGRLREECVQAKEALSSDTDVSIPVLLPNFSTEVRLTRSELEAMVRPALYDSIEALKRALRSAEVTADQLHSVLLVGGSSRMPVVAQLVGAELGRPVSVDAHPKHAVALGAAWLASGALSNQGAARAVVGTPGPSVGVAPVGSAPGGPRPSGSAPVGPVPVGPVPGGPVPGGRSPVPAAAAPLAAASSAPVSSGPEPAVAVPAARSAPAPTGSEPTQFVNPSYLSAGPPAAPPQKAKRSLAGNRSVLIAAGAALIVLLIGGGAAMALTTRNADTPLAGPPSATGTPATTASATAPSIPPFEQCTDAIKTNPRWVCVTKATLTGKEIRIEYSFGNNGTPFNVNGGFHVHFYGANADGSDPSDKIEGAPSDGNWYVEDKQPSVHAAGTSQYNALKGHPVVCVRIANSGHRLVADNTGKGTFTTGNCFTITTS